MPQVSVANDRMLQLKRGAATPFLVFCAILTVAASFSVAPGMRGLFGGALGAIMLAIAAVDARRYIIPNELTLAAFLLCLFYQGVAAPDAGLDAAIQAAIRGVLAAAPLLLLMIGYRFYRGRDGLGLGDVKLMAVAGAWLDWLTIAGVVETAALAAIAFHVIAAYRAGHKLSATKAVPFGMFLAPAIWLGWLAETMLF
jgi:leader peptidase (prepilin peptidase)/N-methyltransferase